MTHFLQIFVSRIPVWVWAILAGLIALGLLQARDQVISRTRVLMLPLGMSALSLYSAIGAFGGLGGVAGASVGGSGLGLAGVLGAWLVGAAMGALLNQPLRLPRQVRALADGRWAVGGSWAPMVLLMAIFWMRFGVAVALSVVPALASQISFATVCCALYGLSAGLLGARALRVLGHRWPGDVGAAAKASSKLSSKAPSVA